MNRELLCLDLTKYKETSRLYSLVPNKRGVLINMGLEKF